jgi:hypothetical protein
VGRNSYLDNKISTLLVLKPIKSFKNELPNSTVRMRSGRSINNPAKRKSTLAQIPDLDPELSVLHPNNDSLGAEDPLLNSIHGVQQADCSASMKYFTGQD